jgi:hypothetical protein
MKCDNVSSDTSFKNILGSITATISNIIQRIVSHLNITFLRLDFVSEMSYDVRNCDIQGASKPALQF